MAALEEPRVTAVLKRDALGRVELLADGARRLVRRVACGSRLPLSRSVARALAARERRALAALDGLPGVPRLLDDARAAAAPSEGRGCAPGDVLLRSWIAGAPLHRVEALPEDFFERLEELVAALHARGVCHNDLHKEQNVLVAEDGWPALIDFQLASVHPLGSRRLAARAREDLRHVRKHARRYARHGALPPARAAGVLARERQRRSALALAWRRLGKPVYLLFTRVLLRARDGEERRDSRGPWPRPAPPLGPRAS